MSFVFRQIDGEISQHDVMGNSAHLCYGYAGKGAGKNNPTMQEIHNVGPLPCGIYTMLAPVNHPHVGKYAIELVPDPKNEMFGRSEFFWHGDSIDEPGNASNGCIVSNPGSRRQAWESGDHQLQVVSGLD